MRNMIPASPRTFGQAILCALFALAALLWSAQPAHAQIGPTSSPASPSDTSSVLALVATQDTWIWKDQTDHNWGTCDSMALDSSGSDDGNGHLLVQFDLATIPIGATITSAQLQLTKIDGTTTPHAINLHRVTAGWDEGPGDCNGQTVPVSWTTRQTSVGWGSNGGDYDGAIIATTAVGANGVYGWDMTATVQDWINGVQPNHGLLLATRESGHELLQFASREHADSSLRPRLLITHSGGAVAGAVWSDENADGQRAAEMGLADITVKLFAGRCGEQNALPVAMTTTDANGDYQFISVPPGDYCVAVDQGDLPGNIINTTDGNAVSVTVSGGQPNDGHDFGYAAIFVDDRLSVGLTACNDVTWLVDKVASYGGNIINGQFDECLFIVEVPPAVQSTLQIDLQDEPQTAFADQDVRARGGFVPNDPDYSNPELVFAPQQINAAAAWDHSTGDPELIIAVLDTGIDASHVEFNGRLLPGYDYVNEDGDPADDQGHGTHVAGIAAAGLHNGIGMSGIAGGSKILPMKVLNANNLGYWSDVAQAIMDAVDEGAKVINMSITGGSSSSALEQAIQYAGQHGAMVVVAAGNDGTNTPQYPASYIEPNLLSVGATTYNGDRWTLSNHGPNVTVMAPGQFIHSTYPGGGYSFLTGTSMAAPHVAGAAALLFSIDPALTPAQVIQHLTASATDLGEPGFDALHGHGRIDLGAAAQAVVDAAPPPPALTLNKAVDKSVAIPSETLAYTLDIDYGGGALVSNALITDRVPAGLTYTPGSVNAGGSESNGVVSWTLGSNQGAVDAAQRSSVTASVRDTFSNVAYNNNNGSADWRNDWIEYDDNGAPGSGNVRIESGRLRVDNNDFNGVFERATRAVDLSGAASAIWRFDYAGYGTGGTDIFVFEASDDNGASWRTFDALNVVGNVSGSRAFNLEDKIDLTDEVLIRYRIDLGFGQSPQQMTLDNVEVEYTRDVDAEAAIAAAPITVMSGARVTVAMTLHASAAVHNVTPSMGFNGTNGVAASLISGPTPASATVDAAGTTFMWAYDVTATDAIGQLTFNGDAAGDGVVTWATAHANSVIVAPQLTFQAIVNDPAAVESAVNVAHFAEEGALGATASNAAATALESSIGDRVWADSDGDMIQDPGEEGVAGVTIRLTDVLSRTTTTVTDANGEYDFGGLEAGTYAISLDVATLPPDYTLFTSPHPRTVHLGAGEDHNGADIGVKGLAAAIGDFIWYDADGDGLQDIGEPGIGNVTLQLFLDDDNDGSFDPVRDFPVDATVSGANGSYLLQTPVEGDYFVIIGDDNGILTGLAHTVGPQSISTPLPAIPLAVGEVHRSADYGFVRAPGNGNGVVSGQVWLDGDASAICEPHEPVIIGGEVCATPTADGSPICDATDLNGRYLLTLPAGAYEIAPSSPPPGLIPTLPVPQTVTVIAGGQETDLDFGYRAPAEEMSALGGEIWQDIAVDDIVDGLYQRASEPGIGNVTVNVIQDLNSDDDWDDGEPILATISDSDGHYRFERLLAGDYVVEVSDTLLVLRRFAQTTIGPNPDADDNNHTQPYATHLDPGENDNTIDFGYREYEASGAGDLPDPGVIGNQIWLDTDEDGIYNPNAGDKPIPGVTVELTQNGQVVRTATSGGDGGYLFVNLEFGNYSVEVSDEFGVLEGRQPTAPGANPSGDNHNKTQPYAVSLNFLQTANQTADFGYLPLTIVEPGDCNGDGALNAGDISALVLEIFDGDGTLPSSSGGGTFGGLGAGCDANGDATINAGDISCTVLLIFNGPGACSVTTDATANLVHSDGPTMPASLTLTIPDAIPAPPETRVRVPISFDPGGEAITALTFAVDYDERWLAFDPTDSDGDGLPDTVQIDLPPMFTAAAHFNPADTDGELDIALFSLATGATLPNGVPVTLLLDVGAPAEPVIAPVIFSADPSPSFGAGDGQSISGSGVDGSVAIIVNGVEPPANDEWSVFLPTVRR